MRYFFHISYFGRNFNGWQKHPNAYAVQSVIEEKISEIFKEPISIVGCGRTDAQVHALQYYFHCDLPDTWDFDLLFRLNMRLPQSIVVHEIIPVGDKAHARFDAVLRSYDFFIHNQNDAFLNQSSSYHPFKKLNLDAIKQALKLLVQYQDYRNFCVGPDKNEHTRCQIKKAQVFVHKNGTQLRFHIAANRFLTKMIRICMWRILQVGEERMSLETFESYFTNLDKQAPIAFSQPNGLYLSGVFYRTIQRPIACAFPLYNHLDWEELI